MSIVLQVQNLVDYISQELVHVKLGNKELYIAPIHQSQKRLQNDCIGQ